FFFFSSRRRHTRFSRDWSSDVCSSDLVPAFDLTFSAPRSVSLAWAFADEDLRRDLETAQARAVRSTLATIEKEAIFARRGKDGIDRKSTRLNSSHVKISYAVFCLTKKT